MTVNDFVDVIGCLASDFFFFVKSFFFRAVSLFSLGSAPAGEIFVDFWLEVAGGAKEERERTV